MAKPTRVTQAHVARAAGVNRSTVSLALHGHPALREATRERIRAIAQKLGYQPDPLLSAMAVYRQGKRASGFQGTLAWLACTTADHMWRRIPTFLDYYKAAARRAEFQGYRLEVVDLNDFGIVWQRAASMMRARGIAGLLVCPQSLSNRELNLFPWEHFSAVSFGHSLRRPALHAVAPSQLRAAFRATQELHLLGYRRIGLMLDAQHNARTDHNYVGGYLAARQLLCGPDIPVLLSRDEEDPRPWLRKTRADAVIVGSPPLRDLLVRHGVDVPRQVGVAALSLAEPGELAGILEPNTAIGEAAVDLLVGMLHRGERGIPTRAKRLLIDGDWHAGATIRTPGIHGAKSSRRRVAATAKI